MMTPGGIGGQPQKIQSAESKKPIEQQPIDQKGTFGTRAMTWMEGVRNAFEDFMELNSSERTLEVFLETVFQPFFTSGGFKAYEEKKNILDQNYYNPPPIENNQGNPQKNIKAASTPSVQEKPSPTLEQKLEITKKKVDDLEVAREKAFNDQETHLETLERLAEAPFSEANKKLSEKAKGDLRTAKTTYLLLTNDVQDAIQELFTLEKSQGITQPSRKIKDLITPMETTKAARKKVADLEGEVRKAHDNPILKSSKSSPEKTAAIKLYNDLTEQLQKARIELDQMEQKR